MPSERPLFLMTAAERKQAENGIGPLATERLMHYRNEAATIYLWDVPEGVPPEYPENAIFDTGGMGIVEYAGSKSPIAGRPVLNGALAEVLRWIPVTAYTYSDSQLLRERHSRENPYFLVDRIPMQDKLRYYCEVQAAAWGTLAQNIDALQQIVVVKSVNGCELKAMDTGDNLKQKTKIWFKLEGASIDAELMDFDAKDHTQNLLTVINAMDAEILSLLGIPSIGTSKTSGISAEESTAISAEMHQILDRGLRLRRQMCELFKAHGLNMSVKLNPAYDLMPEDPEHDRTDNLTDNERTDLDRQQEAAEE